MHECKMSGRFKSKSDGERLPFRFRNQPKSHHDHSKQLRIESINKCQHLKKRAIKEIPYILKPKSMVKQYKHIFQLDGRSLFQNHSGLFVKKVNCIAFTMYKYLIFTTEFIPISSQCYQKIYFKQYIKLQGTLFQTILNTIREYNSKYFTYQGISSSFNSNGDADLTLILWKISESPVDYHFEYRRAPRSYSLQKKTFLKQ